MNENNWQAKWSQTQLQGILREQRNAFWQRPIGVKREQLATVLQYADAPHAVIVSGLRRAGKSTLLLQLAHTLGENAFYYISFDDDRFLGFAADDADTLLNALVQAFGQRRIFIIDEVQNIEGWERFARRWMDQGYKLYITGSNAALLSRELGTRLTGRYLPVELLPFSFGEYLTWAQQQGHVDATILPTPSTLVERALLNRALSTYLQVGGIPEALQYPNLPILRTLYDDVIYRDIATRHRIEAIRALKELAFQVLSNPAGLVSFSKIKQQLGIGNVTTVKNYLQFLEDSWLIFTTYLYDASVKRQQIAPKKAYGIDTGLVNTVGFHTSPNSGHLLENVVFLALRRKTTNIHYALTPSGYEIDFYLPDQRLLVQVAQQLTNPQTYAREIRALQDGLAMFKGAKGLLLSTDAEHFDAPQDDIQICSVSEWLL